MPDSRISRSLGAPALYALMLGAIASSIYYVLGFVAGDALGLTPFVFLLAGLFFVVTMLTYVEGNSLHPERGGASAIARYAFDEFWSFVAGWAILLDYLIVIAIAAFAVSHYLVPFWSDAGGGVAEIAIAGGVIAFVALINVRGLTAARLGLVLRLGLLNLALLVAVVVITGAQSFDLGALTDSVELGSAPSWDDLVFAAVVATVAMTGIEAASGLAGEIRVGRRSLRRVLVISSGTVLALFVGMSVVALMALPVGGGATALGGRFVEAPVLGVVSTFEPAWLMDAFRYLVGVTAALVLIQAASGQMLGLSRLTYSLATHRQIPSAAGKLHPIRATPYVAISAAAVIAFALVLPADLEFLLGIFAFGAMLSFTIAHVAVLRLRFTEADRPSAFRVPLSIPLGRGSLPIPAALGALMAGAAWISVIATHEGARVVGGVWMVAGIVLYVVYRRSQGKPLRKRYTIPEQALQEEPATEYGSILVPIRGDWLDDDIVGTAGRLASEEVEPDEGGPMIEALYVFELPMSLPLDAVVDKARVEEGRRALARAKEVGEEYEGVTVATAMVRGRSRGEEIVAEAKRRGVQAIVLAGEEPTRTRGGTLLGGRGGSRDRFASETTRYVIEKAACRVILTAPPAGEKGVGEGVAP
ncbi:MAG: APC family permease [Thermoleophilaceae bacterium]|nr:APC family permease [Thermoleophilaceae bacterium]